MMSTSSRLNLVCVDDTPYTERVFSWYFQHHHRTGDQVGLVHLYSLPGLDFIFDEEDSSAHKAATEKKKEMNGVLSRVKAMKEKFRLRCIEEMQVTPMIFFENVTETHGKVICQIAAKHSAASIVMSQAGTSLSGVKSDPDIQVSRFVSHNSKSPVLLVPADKMPAMDEKPPVALLSSNFAAHTSPGHPPYGGHRIRGPLPGYMPNNHRFNPMGGRPHHGMMKPDAKPAAAPEPSGPPTDLMSLELPAVNTQQAYSGTTADIPGPPYIVYAYFGERVQEGQIYHMFSHYGRISKVNAMSEKGFGFVHFFDYYEALGAIHCLNGAPTRPGSQKLMQVNFKSATKKDSEEERGPVPDHIMGPPYIVYCYLGRIASVDELYMLFSRFGTILDCQSKTQGFGFVHFQDYHEALQAVNALNGTQIPGARKLLQVRFKDDPKPMEEVTRNLEAEKEFTKDVNIEDMLA